MDAKCRRRSDWLDGAVSFSKSFGQTKVMQIFQGETLNHQGAMTHEVCCLATQYALYLFFTPLENYKTIFTLAYLPESNSIGGLLSLVEDI